LQDAMLNDSTKFVEVYADGIIRKWSDYFVLHKKVKCETIKEDHMISNGQAVTIETETYIGDYKLEWLFNDSTKNIVGFYPFFSASLTPLIWKYLDKEEFGKFTIDNGDLEWNDYDLCFPIGDL